VATLPKPEKTATAPRRRIAPRCICKHSEGVHSALGPCLHSVGCDCPGYKARPARSSVLRSPVARKSAPARTKRKRPSLNPKCKHCAHPAGKHTLARGLKCVRCESCPGYQPAIGIRQKRRTPAAALKLRCDNLWAAIVHARPEMCEVQQYHQHTCNGGYQAMHGVPRTFAATRWLPINGFKGCAGTHKFFTDRPEAWSALLLEAWGLETFRELWSKARAMQPVDMSATYAALRAEAAARGIE
jgi:hypothetical protein